MLVKLADITVFPDRQRKSMDEKKLAELQKSIVDRNGLIQPILIRLSRADDTFRNGGPVTTPFVLVAGGRRYRAHQNLKREEIEANLKEDLPPLEQELCELEENLCREDIAWQDQVQARARINDLRKQLDPNHTAEQTAEELGMTKGNLSKDLQLHVMMQIDPELKAAPTKRAAHRLAEHKMNLARAITQISSVNEGDLKKKLFCADARDFIRTLPDKSIDLIFTDLPYGIDYASASEIKGTHVLGKYDDSEDTVRDFVIDILPQMCRVVKRTGWIVLFFSVDGMEWLREHLQEACTTHGEYGMPGAGCPKHDPKGEACAYLTPEPMPWIWYRPNSRNLSMHPDRHAKHVYETMLAVNGSRARMVLHNQPDVFVYDQDYENRLHEMQKPFALCADVIRRLTVPGQVVADFCFGSGSHLAAAASLSRDFLGCDNNPDNLSSALSLVAQHYKSATLDAAKKGLEGATRSAQEVEEDEIIAKLNS